MGRISELGEDLGYNHKFFNGLNYKYPSGEFQNAPVRDQKTISQPELLWTLDRSQGRVADVGNDFINDLYWPEDEMHKDTVTFEPFWNAINQRRLSLHHRKEMGEGRGSFPPTTVRNFVQGIRNPTSLFIYLISSLKNGYHPNYQLPMKALKPCPFDSSLSFMLCVFLRTYALINFHAFSLVNLPIGSVLHNPYTQILDLHNKARTFPISISTFTISKL